MRSSAGFVSLAIVVLASAGCGSTKTATATAASSSPRPATRKTTRTPAPPIKQATYAVHLAAIKAAPKGAPKGSGFAAISIDAYTNELCWTFSQLKNVPAPDEAQLRGDLPSAVTVTELSDANGQYKASECYLEPQLLLSSIERNPHKFSLNIQNHNHPERAVRGRL